MPRKLIVSSTVLAAMLAVASTSASTVHGDATRDHVPGAEAWRAAASSGVPLEVVVDGHTLALHLRRDASLLGADARMTGPDGGSAPPVTVLAGEMGDTPGWARAAIAADRVWATLATPGLGLISIAPRTDGGHGIVRSSEVSARLRAAGVDTRIEPDAAGMAEDCDSLAWTPVAADPTSLLEEDPLRTFDVALAVDSSFVALHPSDWSAVATAFMAAIDQLFRDAFEVRIRVVHVVAIDDEDIPGTTTDVVLDSLQDHYVATYPSLARDNVHLFTGRDMTNAGGQVNCVGSAGRTTVSYSVAEGNPGGNFNWFGLVLLPDGAVKIGAHELAHTLSAHHHYANCVESVPGFDPFLPLDACTIMINDWGLIQPVFSSLTRLTVRGWVDHYDI